MKTKACRRCGKQKSPDGFYKNSRTSDGRQSWCKQCIADSNRENYHNKGERGRNAHLSGEHLFAACEDGLTRWHLSIRTINIHQILQQ